MVALLVQLKLTLLRNSLRRSVWRTVGLILGGAYALGLVAAVLAGMVALRFTSAVTTGNVTVLAFSGLSVGWLLLSLLVFGVDETVDPAKFALLPVRARDLLPGLLVAALVGVPGVATVLVGLGLVVAWSRSVLLVVVALVALVLGVTTCVLLARAATSAFAASLSSRRFRDLAFVALALVGGAFAIVGNLISGVVRLSPDRLRAVLDAAAGVAGWTPFGWAWTVPADVARGRWLAAGLHLLLAVGLMVALWSAWGYLLGRRLVEPVEAGGAAVRVRRSSIVDRLYPATPAGAVAARTLRYWRRDPRYVAAVAGFLIGPAAILVVSLTSPDTSPVIGVLAPSVLALLVGASIAADLSFDGSAVWTHVTAGLDGTADRRGRVLSSLTVYGSLLVVMVGLALVLTGEWRLLPLSVGLAVAFLCAGLGVGSVVGVLWQWPAPAPGSNPFARNGTGGLASALSFSVTTAGTMVLTLPTLVLAVASIWVPWAGWAALPVGTVNGLIVLQQGVVRGGRLLDRRWPEVMLAVSERSG
ncbi:hypothetical protein [uncultured Friedmanniella sp.]|uniref:hypothetical protein n=1 Tax=uncultured Friedmanniella sp. TaxID=335381 RepID=UPI0035C95D44